MLPLQIRVNLEAMAMKGVSPHSPNLPNWSRAIRLFNVISRTLIEGSYSPAEVQSVYFTAPADWGGEMPLGGTELENNQKESVKVSIVLQLARDLRNVSSCYLSLLLSHLTITRVRT